MTLIADLIYNLQNPGKAPFVVRFEIFASEILQAIANWPKNHAKYQQQPAQYFVHSIESPASAEQHKARFIDILEQQINSKVQRTVSRIELYANRYASFKNYFEQRIIKIQLSNPLVFYDDKAMRIDLGYGPKEFIPLFSDFLDYRGLFDALILGGVSVFNDSPRHHFVNICMHDEYKESLNNETSQIMANADSLLSIPSISKKPTVINAFDAFKDSMLIKACLKENQGFILAEKHADKSPKQFLVDNMALLKSLGVTTIYMEHLLHDRHQSMLDDYMNSSANNTSLPKELELYLKQLDKERNLSGMASYTGVVRTAKKFQIRIIAIDSEAIYRLGVKNKLIDLDDEENTKSRIKAMNTRMLELHRHYYDGNKFTSLIGNAHSSTCLGVPGVSDVLAVPNLVIADIEDERQECIQQNTTVNYNSIALTFEILYQRHVGSKRNVETRPIGFFLQQPVAIFPINSLVHMQAELEDYINQRQSEWSFHYNFLGLVGLFYFIQDYLSGSDHFNSKNRDVKLRAANKLNSLVDDGSLQFSPAELRACSEGRLGRIVNAYGGMGNIKQVALANSNLESNNLITQV